VAKEEAYERRSVLQVVPVDPDKFIDKFIKQLSSTRIILESEDDRRREAFLIQQIVINLAIKILRTWCGTGNMIMAIYSEEAMKIDFKRKILGILETTYAISDAMIEELKSKIEQLHRVKEREEKERILTEINILITELTLLPDALLISIDAFIGALQTNLPIDMMSNLIKSHMGHVTT